MNSKRVSLAAVLALLSVPAFATSGTGPGGGTINVAPGAVQGGAGGAGGVVTMAPGAVQGGSAYSGGSRVNTRQDTSITNNIQTAPGYGYGDGSGYGRSPGAIFLAPPGMAVANDTCAATASVGGAGGGLVESIAVALGIPFTMPGCEARADSNQALRLGMPAAAVERMCERSAFRRAAQRAGTPCAADRPQQQEVSYQTQPQLVMTPSTAADPTANRQKCESTAKVRNKTSFHMDYLRANCGWQ